MKARPRQIDQNKPFQCIDNVEKFLQAEGQEHEVATTSSILTPDMLAAQNLQNKQQQQPIIKKTIQPTVIKPLLNYPQPEFIRYMDGLYPKGDKYELNEMDIQFLNVFNQKLKQQSINIQVKPDELEAFIELLDMKSGKYIVLDYDALLKQFNDPLPESIGHLEYNQQLELYNHWKKYREELGRTILRSIMHPDLQDQNPHLAFRPRVAPSDRTMKLRRGTQTQGRGQTDWDNMAQKVISLRSELNQAQHLLKLLMIRDQGTEIQRRINFADFDKKYQLEINTNHSRHPPEINSFSENCFINKKDPQFNHWSDQLIKESNDWHKYYQQLREHEESDPVLKRLQISFGAVSIRQIPQPQPETPSYPIYQHPPSKHKLQKDDEYIDEKRESVTKFISTLYLEAKKVNLSFDKVMNQTLTLSNFMPTTSATNQRVPINQFPAVLPGIEVPAQPQPQVAPKMKQMIQFSPFRSKKTNLIYRIPMNQDLLVQMKSLIEFQNTNSLYGQYDYFRDRAKHILQLSDMDGQLAQEGIEEDRQDDEDLKQLRKKIKISQNKAISISQQAPVVK